MKCLDCGCDLFFDNHVRCITCAVTMQARPPARDWKPVVGEKVLIEAEFVSDETDCWKLNIKTYRQPKHGIDIFVPLSSIHPMTDAGRDETLNERNEQ